MARTPAFAWWEWIGAGMALLAGWHLLALRIRSGGLPGGDEGSWMAVAGQLARGQGFTTRWLEAHFLVPYTVPRPDDFRYPILTSLLAASFRIWGVSVETARWAVATVFLAFAASAYAVFRSAFGRWPAMAGLWVTVTSLLQLEWNSVVYTEGLFGCAVAALAAWSLRGERRLEPEDFFGIRSKAWWLILGGGVALLYLVRVNGILFLPGILWLYWRKRDILTWKHPAMALAAFLILALPWLIHTAIAFGNPFHFAGSGGLLRDPGVARTQSHTLTIAEYFSRHEALFPLRRVFVGAFRFFRELHRFEHGLEVAPLLLAASALWNRRKFFSPFLAAGFLLTFAASAYVAYNDSWAGLRYMSGLLPFVYAYGLSRLPAWVSAASNFTSGIFDRDGRTPIGPSGVPTVTYRLPGLEGAFGLLLLLMLLLPVIYPHRFYERKLGGIIASRGLYAYCPGLAEHLLKLEALVPPEGNYYARSLCGVNVMSPARNCIGLQELYDPTWFSRSLAAFHPTIIALTPAETRDSVVLTALSTMRAAGYAQDTISIGLQSVFLSLHPIGRPP